MPDKPRWPGPGEIRLGYLASLVGLISQTQQKSDDFTTITRATRTLIRQNYYKLMAQEFPAGYDTDLVNNGQVLERPNSAFKRPSYKYSRATMTWRTHQITRSGCLHLFVREHLASLSQTLQSAEGPLGTLFDEALRLANQEWEGPVPEGQYELAAQ